MIRVLKAYWNHAFRSTWVTIVYQNGAKVTFKVMEFEYKSPKPGEAEVSWHVGNTRRGCPVLVTPEQILAIYYGKV